MSKKTILPVILCGGFGTRLWPASRESFPKQFLKLRENDTKSLLQKTQERITKLKNVENPLIICNEEHRFIVAEQMREIGIKPYQIILEPFSRNTAPAITIAALISLENNEDRNLLVLAADHEINDTNTFIKVINKGIEYLDKDYLVTFGIIPDSPETGFGYIEGFKKFNKEKIEGIEIKRFIEKPNLDLAKKLIKNKYFTWNSGMFLFRATTYIKELKKYAPDILNSCTKSINKKKIDLDFLRIEKDAFKFCPDISVDFAIMEKTKKGIVLPLDVGWSDVGSWKSIWEKSPKDKNNNFIEGKISLWETRNSFFKSENSLIVGIGVEGLVVVETRDAVLIANKNQTERIKEVVQKLKKEGIDEVIKHKKIYRPWGHFVSIEEGSKWQIKKIIVKPGASLSLQMHHHRSEHWVVVKGTANVEINETKKSLIENQSIYIPLGSKHRLSNPGVINLVLIEIQTGTYLGEDDIIRFKDNYGRN